LNVLRGLALIIALASALAFLPLAESDGPIVGPSSPLSDHPEAGLVNGLFEIQQGRIGSAMKGISELVRRQPDFHLAQLVYGDLLAAQAGQIDRLTESVQGEGPLDELWQEARARYGRYADGHPKAELPSQLLRIPENVESALVVDVANYRLFVFRNGPGGPRLESDFYVSIGKGGSDKRREGDEKTPVGVYRVSSYLPGEKLPDMYGVGAFPISYPNDWDVLLGRTGSGIWIHGTEFDRFSRAPLSSLGCVTLSNSDFFSLRRNVKVGRTPVVVAKGLDWRSRQEVSRMGREMASVVDRWRRDWESLDTENYLSHYSPNFRSEGMDYGRFAAHKRRVNASKTELKVELRDVGIYRYPGEKNLVMVEFTQRYESNNFRASRRKQQFWRYGTEGWRILYEAGLS
jgi:murein L,D-transpeptidase YafK